ncbi:hypothetical protein ACT7DH_03610 [Bacillus pacificus]
MEKLARFDKRTADSIPINAQSVVRAAKFTCERRPCDTPDLSIIGVYHCPNLEASNANNVTTMNNRNPVTFVVVAKKFSFPAPLTPFVNII